MMKRLATALAFALAACSDGNGGFEQAGSNKDEEEHVEAPTQYEPQPNDQVEAVAADAEVGVPPDNILGAYLTLYDLQKSHDGRVSRFGISMADKNLKKDTRHFRFEAVVGLQYNVQHSIAYTMQHPKYNAILTISGENRENVAKASESAVVIASYPGAQSVSASGAKAIDMSLP